MGHKKRRKAATEGTAATRPADGPSLETPPRRTSWLIVASLALGLALATLWLYAPVRHADFLHYDDREYVVDNGHVSGGLSPTNTYWAFTAFAAANWHPLTWISHQLDCELFGLEPGGHHLTNAVLHAANAGLLLLVLFSLTGALMPSLFVAVAFAVHPLNVESVAWVAERKNVLSTFFWILTMGAWGRYARQPSWRRYVLVGLLVALALLAKPMAVTLPCVLLLLDVWPLRRLQLAAPGAWRSAWRLLREKLPLFALAAGGALLTVLAQGGAGATASLEQVPLRFRVTNAIASYVVYLGKTAWPVDLAVFYPHPGARLQLGVVVASLVFLGLLSAFCWRLRDRAPQLVVGWLWYLGTLVPVIGLVQVGSQARADRYAYQPLLGIFLALAWSVPRRAAVALGVATAVVAATLWPVTRQQLSYWTDSLTLFARAGAVTTNNYTAYNGLGLALANAKRWDEAVESFDRAVKIYPLSADTFTHRGLALARTGRTDEAIASLEQALHLDPDSMRAHTYLGVALQRRDARRAIEHFECAIALQPDANEPRTSLGTLLLMSGQTKRGRATLAEALALDPQSAAVHFRVGSAYLEAGALDEALTYFDQALTLNPRHADAHNSRGVVLLRRGRLVEAETEFRRTLELEPGHVDARANSGVVAFRSGRIEDARGLLEAALRANSRHADAHATLGAIQARERRLDLAFPHFRAAVEADPWNAVARNNLGAALLESGDVTGALEQLERAVELNPRHVESLANLGGALLRAGRTSEAIVRLEAALALAPDHTAAQSNLKAARAVLAGARLVPAPDQKAK